MKDDQSEREMREDYLRCADVVQRLASQYPEYRKSWEGTVSERLTFLVKKRVRR